MNFELLKTEIINQVSQTNSMFAQTLEDELTYISSEFPEIQNRLWEKFIIFLNLQGKDLRYGLDCLNKKLEDIFDEELNFFRTGKYSHSSFDEVNKAVYNSPKVMEYHTVGLIMLEILTSMNYKKLQFLIESVQGLKSNISRYLEIGGGHGMYLWEAEKVLSKSVVFDLVDISQTSIDIAKLFLQEISSINYYHQDIFSFSSPIRYDFISMCEILEHLENPNELLIKAKTLLNPNGRIFITVPINNPAIDHIYLFNSVEEIRSLLHQNSLTIISEKCVPLYNNISISEAEKRKMPIDYFALAKTLD